MTTMTHDVWCRKPFILNTDPQRRCYHGVNFSEQKEWGGWYSVCGYPSEESAQRTAGVFKAINPTWEYEVRQRYTRKMTS